MSKINKKPEGNSFADRFKGKTTTLDKSGVIGVVLQKSTGISKQTQNTYDKQQQVNSLKEYGTVEYLKSEDDVLTPIQKKQKKLPTKVFPINDRSNTNTQHNNKANNANLDLRQDIDSYKDSNGNKRYFLKSEKKSWNNTTPLKWNTNGSYEDLSKSQLPMPPPPQQMQKYSSEGNQSLYRSVQGGLLNSQKPLLNSAQSRLYQNSQQQFDNYRSVQQWPQNPFKAQSQEALTSNYSQFSSMENKMNSNFNYNTQSGPYNNFQGSNLINGQPEEYQLIAVPKRFLEQSMQQQQPQNTNGYGNTNNYNLMNSYGRWNNLQQQQQSYQNNNTLHQNSFPRINNNNNSQSYFRNGQQISSGAKFYGSDNNLNKIPYSERYDLTTSYLNNQKQQQDNPFMNSNQLQFGHQKLTQKDQNSNKQEYMYQLDELENKHKEIINALDSISRTQNKKQKQQRN